MKSLLAVVAAALAVAAVVAEPGKTTVSLEKQPVAEMLVEKVADTKRAVVNAFLIPHSHCDAGWLRTIDEYYVNEVKYIYNTVIEEMGKRADRKFIIVEMIYFSRWYNEATDAQRASVHEFVEAKRIEFVLGGWVMNDDADPTFGASINQMAEGHEWIFNTFGEVPRYGWHIDPFGLSSYYPVLFANMGFNGHVINRIHHTQKDQWKSSKHLEFIWRGSTSLGDTADVFTHVLDSHYSFPNNFNFETSTPIVDRNLERRAVDLSNELKRRAEWFATENLLVPGGDDFRWQNAAVQYNNWDKLIDHINANVDTYGVTIKYATLADYFETVNKVEHKWPVYEEDFFPYADGDEAYWTGYFTSYANVKSLIRTTATLLRNTELLGQAASFARPLSDDPKQLLPLRQAQAESQHHDGVTGTSKNYVMQMYIDHLNDGAAPAKLLMSSALSAITLESSSFADLPTLIGQLSNNGQVVPIVLTNGLGWERYQVPVDIELTRTDIEIVDANGNVVPYQSTTFAGKTTLTFLADVPAAGLCTYFARVTASPVIAVLTQVNPGEVINLSNKAISLNITILASSVNVDSVNLIDGTVISFTEQLMEYHSHSSGGQNSGAYIFRPEGVANALPSTASIYKVVGPVFEQVLHTYDDSHKQAFKLYHSANLEVEQQLDVGISLGSLQSDREAIARFTALSFNSNDVHLYSDNNGLLMHKRTQQVNNFIPANYYPMVYQAYLSDGVKELLAITDRTIGVGTLQAGEVEFMLHRRCSQDDGRGVGEALDDTSVTTPHLFFYLGSAASVETLRPRLAITHQHKPVPFYGPITTISAWTPTHNIAYSALFRALPNNVHLLAVKTVLDSAWKTAIVRLQNIYDLDSVSGLGVAVEVDLGTLFNGNYTVSAELDLTGVVAKGELPRLQWTPDTVTPPWVVPNNKHSRSVAEDDNASVSAKSADNAPVVVLNPMEIHTFKITTL